MRVCLNGNLGHPLKFYKIEDVGSCVKTNELSICLRYGIEHDDPDNLILLLLRNMFFEALMKFFEAVV